MPYTPFMPDFDQLPAALPIFPLSGAVVMPGASLPLNIFEPRYLNMVADAMSSHHLIGMVQPDLSKPEQSGAVFNTGCAGRITGYQETGDGRLEIVLVGACRYRLVEEINSMRGYRVVVPDWAPFRIDCEAQRHTAVSNRDRLITLLRRYFVARQLEINWKTLVSFPPERLVNSLITVLPLGSMEKQALLEAVTPQDRVDTLITTLEIQTGEAAVASKH
jgi:Lon protease-like protein